MFAVSALPLPCSRRCELSPSAERKTFMHITYQSNDHNALTLAMFPLANLFDSLLPEVVHTIRDSFAEGLQSLKHGTLSI